MTITKEMKNIPEGAFFTVSSGCYSDYMVSGVFRALKEIPTAQLLETYLSERPSQRSHYGFRDGEFLADVTRQGYIEPIDSWNWHMSNYGDASEMDVSDQ
jgi:hypothetical protein